jgi:hypothetical protein
LEGLIEVGDGFVVLLQGIVGSAATVVGTAVLWLKLEDLIEVRNGFVISLGSAKS